jgi:aminomethyltransferase
VTHAGQTTSEVISKQAKRTPLYDVHVRAGAKIVEFAGYDMPVQYKGVLEEHSAVRNNVGLFDVSHMGEIEVWGSDAADFVQRITTNDVSKLHEGRVQYSAMCYDDGGIVDDLLVYHLGDHFMLVVNASNISKDFAWMQLHASGDVSLRNVSNEVALLAIQGPHSLHTLQKLTDADLSSLSYYHSIRAHLAGTEMTISRTGYTGELGFEIYFEANRTVAEHVWTAVMSAGEADGIMPIGLGARDTLRLEMGFCLYGNDIDQTTNPLEAGLGWITKLEKGEFTGRNEILKVRTAGLKRRLVGFTMDGKAFPRHGYLLRSEGRSVGSVTSGTFSPTLEQGIGMGYVDVNLAHVGRSVSVVIRDKEIPSTIVALPFVKKGKA